MSTTNIKIMAVPDSAFKPRECSRCLITSAVPGADIGESGECAYCRLHDRLAARYPNDMRGLEKFDRLIAEIKTAGRGKPYACLVGVSGGVDSSYLLHLAVLRGLRPLAVHVDNGFDKPVALQNISRLCSALGVDRIDYQVGNSEYQAICRAFLRASVSDADIPNDIAMTTLIMRAAERYGIKYVLNGHDFRTEGSCPLGWTYMDGRYIRSVYRYFSGGAEIFDFPVLTFRDQLRWAAKGIKQVRPLYYLDFDREREADYLASNYGWEPYGAKHCENLYTEFIGSYYLPRKFGIDKRVLYVSALIRSGKLIKPWGRKILAVPPDRDYYVPGSESILPRVKITRSELDRIMALPRRFYQEFDTYHPLFIRYRRLIRLASRLGLLPETFAEKYTGGKG